MKVPFTAYICDSWSVTLREGHILMSRLFEPQREREGERERERT
jgi:hypothetical protein